MAVKFVLPDGTVTDLGSGVVRVDLPQGPAGPAGADGVVGNVTGDTGTATAPSSLAIEGSSGATVTVTQPGGAGTAATATVRAASPGFAIAMSIALG